MVTRVMVALTSRRLLTIMTVLVAATIATTHRGTGLGISALRVPCSVDVHFSGADRVLSRGGP